MAEKWDVHTHTTLSPRTYDALERFTAYEQFVRIRAHKTTPCCAEMINSKGEVQRVINDNCYDGAARIRDCEEHGVTMQVLSPTPMMIPDYVEKKEDAAEICRILNDHNAELVAKFPDRFTAVGALPMRFPDEAIKELERIKGLGMRGIEVNSNIDDVDMGDPQFFPIYEAVDQLDMAILEHPWGGFMSPTEERLRRRMRPALNWRPWLIGMGMETALAFDSMRCNAVHERLPNLRVLYVHGGGAFPALLGRLEHGAYCRPDLFTGPAQKDPYQTVAHCGVYTDSLTHNPAVLKMLLALLGPSRIAMGSDYPYPLGELDTIGEKGIYPGAMIEGLSDVSAEDKQRMLAGTAKEWLGVSE